MALKKLILHLVRQNFLTMKILIILYDKWFKTFIENLSIKINILKVKL